VVIPLRLNSDNSVTVEAYLDTKTDGKTPGPIQYNVIRRK